MDEKYGLYLEWSGSIDEAIACLVTTANGVNGTNASWYQCKQHKSDTRGIVTERAAKAIRKVQADNARLQAEVEGLRATLKQIADQHPPTKDARYTLNPDIDGQCRARIQAIHQYYADIAAAALKVAESEVTT